MVLLGTLVNAALIVIGTLFGLLFHRIPERMKETVTAAIGLAVVLLGVQMGLKSENFLIVIGSLVAGAALGEWWKLDEKLNEIGYQLERKIGGNRKSSIAEGFVTATLIFVIGAMAVIGALDSGLRGDHDVLYTKGMIDGFTALVLASSLGIGVMFSAVPVLLYQGAIALLAIQIMKFIPETLMDSFILEMTATGGVMIVAIGLNLAGITRIRVANLLPGILMVALVVTVLHMVP
ncbi:MULTISPECIES: DUF554 domain-containing protein [Exiguobacterium]|uniref:Protein of uncharacterized function (DUF554) n=1 Tax=Exiguobacterium aurantiacum TaxID=33987 RepID=A0A377FWC4_9BACL|nr:MULTISPECIES: DUF554 domain-containing protein [Exiguobacterium]STO09111.1 Protein of uncharacterised function (DUF554) [Exiguobacterium aurantiacum]